MAFLIPLLAGAVVGGIAGSQGGGGGGSVQQVNPTESLRDQLEAELDLGPEFLDLARRLQPGYSQLETDNLRNTLLGSPGGTRFEQFIDTRPVPGQTTVAGFDSVAGANWNQSHIDAVSSAIDTYGSWEDVPLEHRNAILPYGGGTHPTQDRRRYAQPTISTTGPTTESFTNTREISAGEGDGLLALLEEIAPTTDRLQNESMRRNRAAEISDLEELGPEFIQAQRGFNPEITAMIDLMRSQRMEDLEAGRNLSSAEAREHEQRLRSNPAFRGMGNSPSSIFMEALNMGQIAEDRQRRRQGDATGQIGLEQAYFGNPFEAIFGRSSGSLPVSQSFINSAGAVNANAGPSSFLPIQGAFQEAGAFNANASNAASIAAGNNRAATRGALIGGVASLGGSVFSAAGGIAGGG